MKYIISGTNRPGSNSLEVSKILQSYYKELGEEFEILDLKDIPLDQMNGQAYSKDQQSSELQKLVTEIDRCEALIIVCPEYNGSYPGILKLFIDHWSYPSSFESRPVCFVGLGGRFGGLRPVEHLQHVFGYRNAYVFPQRVFISNVWSVVKEGKLLDENIQGLLKKQCQGFVSFYKALKTAGLDACSLAKK